jgi:hypothetical protein
MPTVGALRPVALGLQSPSHLPEADALAVEIEHPSESRLFIFVGHQLAPLQP